MAIQSGFGIDDRFRMDSRFAESDEEGEEEKGEATGEGNFCVLLPRRPFCYYFKGPVRRI